MIRRLKIWLGYSDKLDMGIKNTYLILSLILSILSGWLLIDIFLLHDWEIAKQGALLILMFAPIYILLKKKYYFSAKNALLLVSFFQMYVSIFISFGPDSSVKNILYLLVPQATMIYDVKFIKEKAMIVFSIIASSSMLMVSILQESSMQEVVIQGATALTIMIIFSVVFFNYSYQLNKAFGELNDIASIDVLTGIYNRRAFSEMGEKCFQNGMKTPFALAVFDLDHFKKINDSWGHPVGDIVLKYVASTVKNGIRSKDFFARIGGEEFAIILEDVDLLSSKTVMEKLRKSIEDLKIPVDDKTFVNITISIGISVYRPTQKRFDELFLQSDEALYKAKNNGRNQIQVYTLLE